MKAVSTLVGVLWFSQTALFAFWMMGGNPLALIQIPDFMLVAFLPIAPLLMAFGFQNTWRAYASLKYLFITPSSVADRTDLRARIVVVAQLLKATYAAGGIALLFGSIVTIGHIDGGVIEISNHVSATLTAAVYTLLLSELLWRPLKNRLEALHDSMQ